MNSWPLIYVFGGFIEVMLNAGSFIFQTDAINFNSDHFRTVNPTVATTSAVPSSPMSSSAALFCAVTLSTTSCVSERHASLVIRSAALAAKLERSAITGSSSSNKRVAI